MDSKDLTHQALSLHQSGQLQQAADAYQKAIALDAGNADALQFYGLLLFQRGNGSEAISHIKRAIKIKPDVAPYYDNLGVVLEAAGQYQAALESYQSADEIDQKDPDRCFNMAVVLEKLGRLDQAETAYRAAIALKPDDSASHFNLGNLLKNQDNLEAACRSYDNASRCSTVASGTHNNLGNVLLRLGQYERAVEAFERSLKIQPEEISALLNLGVANIELGKLETAASYLKQYTALAPDTGHASLALGRLEMLRGNQLAAIRAYRTALDSEFDNEDARLGLAAVFRTYSPSYFEPEIAELLLMLFSDKQISHQSIARLTANQIKYQLGLTQTASESTAAQDIDLQRIADTPLLINLLLNALNTDPIMERFLKHLRKRLLRQAVEQHHLESSMETLCTAIAIQCFANEYLYSVELDEQVSLQTLKARITIADSSCSPLQPQIPIDLSIVAMYEPLAETIWADSLAAMPPDHYSSGFNTLIRLTVSQPLEEKSIKSRIRHLAPLENDVSSAVREQYEQNPYPRWFKLPMRHKTSYHQYLRQLFPQFDPPAFLESAVSVLNAGCGTGQEAAMISQSRLVTDIVGLDLSATSLAHGQRMANLLAIETLCFIQGDILDCSKLDREFAVIESTGVLHHMQDPVAGWRALLDCLQPGGVMKVGLYSTLASIEVNQARQIIQQRHLDSKAGTIRSFREEILNKAESDTLYALRYSDDFYSISACRDLLFHVQEQSYTLPQLGKILEQLDLKFIGFELADPKVRRKFKQQFAQDDALQNLENWDSFEKKHPQTFAAMYVFWCQKL